MENLTLTNKNTQYTAKANAANVKIEGQVLLNDSLKVINFNGSVSALETTPQSYFGNFSYNNTNVSVNLNTNKEFLVEASQLILDTIAEIELTVNVV